MNPTPCRQIQNQAGCNCTYPCDRHGLCCDCIAYHRRADELPACYFDAGAEKTYDRSIAAFSRSRRGTGNRSS